MHETKKRASFILNRRARPVTKEKDEGERLQRRSGSNHRAMFEQALIGEVCANQPRRGNHHQGDRENLCNPSLSNVFGHGVPHGVVQPGHHVRFGEFVQGIDQQLQRKHHHEP